MSNYKDNFIFKESTIKKAMELLKKNGEKNLVVIDNKKKLLGTISDGDIRKAILKKKSLDSKILDVYRKKCYFFYENNYSTYQAKKILTDNLIGIIPIINKEKYVVNIISWQDIFKQKKIKKIKNNIPVIIMAGGMGTRLKPLTNIIPKPLIPINDKTLIENIIDKFYSFGLKKYFITLNFKSELIKAYFKYVNSKCSIKFIQENKPLGTVGSLYLLKNIIKNTFIVSNCDTIINIDYNDLVNYHKKNHNDLTLVVCKKQFQIPYGICDINSKGYLKKINEKPKYEVIANVGLYILEPNIFKILNKSEYLDFNQLLNKCLKLRKKIGVFPINNDDWLDIGNNQEYLEFLKKTSV